MNKQITSVQNPLIKSLLLLQEKAKARKKSGNFIIEGKREIELALKGNYTLEQILVCTDMFEDHLFIKKINDVETIEISKEVYSKLAYRDTTEGIIAVAKCKNHALIDLKLPKNPLILVMENIEKPGNIGAMLRTCDAAKVDAVILANTKTDLYNPNVVRSSVGCLFTNQIAVASNEDVIAFLNQNKIKFYSATLQNSNSYHVENYTKPTALVVGTEATGLTQIWRTQAYQNINIPMQGVIDSMNVSVAAAILIFEAKRQRDFKP
ncbi:TrmH family RNA methyltransferase [Flavobacterium croceum DSM 17960]|uniref:TrmH family RNA methyltransferase n=1 Tax=Flavobacterium croceum DSM 17960 TaxID=1121886 RepID=A0A2S4N5V7_9FLAO|nr:RNA methyltransferase [Flavobacterium croceum]POS01099.1 TrmH family RNA methyltransferase [Flavobacterium croceum DSM 17960]